MARHLSLNIGLEKIDPVLKRWTKRLAPLQSKGSPKERVSAGQATLVS